MTGEGKFKDGSSASVQSDTGGREHNADNVGGYFVANRIPNNHQSERRANGDLTSQRM